MIILPLVPHPPHPEPQRLGEFARIARYFRPLAAAYPLAFDLVDDAALIEVPPGQQLVVTSDALVAGVHFYPDDPPRLIAQKSLRVNLSDLAAKGATPLGYSLGFIAPHRLDDGWLAEFAAGLAEDQQRFHLSLIGGDSVETPGPLSLAITAYGLVPSGQMVRRSGVRPGDELWVTGTIGDGALGLLARQGRLESPELLARYLLPEPRLALHQSLRQCASAALDVSDGLVADAGHLARASGVALILERDSIPLSAAAASLVARDPQFWQPILSGGDDYEILFSTSPQNSAKIPAVTEGRGFALTRIGRAVAVTGAEPGVEVITSEGKAVPLVTAGWQHGIRD
ncbi:MAG: thiamine-phosphate kinase [Alphaproteobacteria bacterium]|nr:thiamine-phosphate kinase [Alphaproteobacteria bacterium]